MVFVTSLLSKFKNVHSSFIGFTQTISNVYGDNVDFDTKYNSEWFQYAQIFLNDIGIAIDSLGRVYWKEPLSNGWIWRFANLR